MAEATNPMCPASGTNVGRMLPIPGSDDWRIECPTCGMTWGGGSTVLDEHAPPHGVSVPVADDDAALEAWAVSDEVDVDRSDPKVLRVDAARRYGRDVLARHRQDTDPDEPISDDRAPGEDKVDHRMARADGILAMADAEVTDPAVRAIIRKAAAGEITGDEAVAQIAAHHGVDLG